MLRVQFVGGRNIGFHFELRRWYQLPFYVIAQRRGRTATYALVSRGGDPFGVTIWRRGAISFLGPGPDGVPLQIVIGDWWKAHDEKDRS